MKKLHIGVLGVYRGSSMINYCKRAENADVVAICDKSAEALEEHKKKSVGCNIAYYDDFDRFIEHDMDAVVLANYANEHAPFAIKALNEGDIIGIFPEGTINREKKTPTLPFKIGAVKMANTTSRLIVPFVITGKYKLFSSKITIEFLDPRKISNNLDKENQKLREEIDKKLEDYYERNQSNKTKDD